MKSKFSCNLYLNFFFFCMAFYILFISVLRGLQLCLAPPCAGQCRILLVYINLYCDVIIPMCARAQCSVEFILVLF